MITNPGPLVGGRWLKERCGYRPAMTILFTSEHFPADDALVRRTLQDMPGVDYARGGIHNQVWFDAFEFDTESVEDSSFAGAKARRNQIMKAYDVADGHWLPDRDDGLGLEIRHHAGWGNWRRRTMTPWYHAFLYDDPDNAPTQRQVLEFAKAAFPDQHVCTIAENERWPGYKALGAPGMEYHGCTLDLELCDVVVLDDVGGHNPEHMSNVGDLMLDPLAFVLVLGPDNRLLRKAVLDEGGRAPKHVPRMPSPELIEVLEDQGIKFIKVCSIKTTE